MVFTVGKVAEFLTNGRLTGATYFDKDGIMRVSPSGGIRLNHDHLTKAPLGMRVESARTNVLTIQTANPVDLTNVALVGDVAAVLSVVNDAAALAAAGLSAVCTSGKVYKLDNTLGVVRAGARIVGAPTLNVPNALSAYVRGGTGSLAFVTTGDVSHVGETPFLSAAGYRRVSHKTTPTTSERMAVHAEAGQVVYFILPQLETGPSVSSAIICAGSATTRAADALTVTGHEAALWFNPDAWTMFFTFDPGDLATGEKGIFSTDTGPFAKVRADGKLAFGFNAYEKVMVHPTAITAGVRKAAIAYAAGEYAASIDGGAVQKAYPGTSSGANLITDAGGPSLLDGHLRRLGYYPRRMTDADLMAASV